MTREIAQRQPAAERDLAPVRHLVGVQIIVDEGGRVVVVHNHPDAQIQLWPRGSQPDERDDLPWHRYGAIGFETACGIKFGHGGSAVRAFVFDARMCPDCFTARELALGRAADTVRTRAHTAGETERTALSAVDGERARMFNRHDPDEET